MNVSDVFDSGFKNSYLCQFSYRLKIPKLTSNEKVEHLWSLSLSPFTWPVFILKFKKAYQDQSRKKDFYMTNNFLQEADFSWKDKVLSQITNYIFSDQFCYWTQYT